MIFADPSLSASGSVSCATCHDPDHAFGSAINAPVPVAGPNLATPGFGNAPSLRYVSSTPAFSFSFDGDGAPSGGFDRDGRANPLIEQARRPFLAEHEMATATVTDVSDQPSRAPYAAQFTALFGADIFEQPELALHRALAALQQYETEDIDFAPSTTSKYDACLAGKARLTDTEMRGLALFNDPRKGNCATCHPSGHGPDGEAPPFTDFSYDNLGVPRNPATSANADATYFELGLCGPIRVDLALSAPYFHNGRFASLTEALRFYVQRDTNPEAWYPSDADGRVRKFDDLPLEYIANGNVSEVAYNRKVGDIPALDSAEIVDRIAFLQTLTDGFQR